MTEKYTAFRNFMVNELGITRVDIEAWTKETVAREVAKLVGQLNIAGMVSREVDSQVKSGIFKSSYSRELSEDVRTLVRQAIAAEIEGRIHFTNKDDK